MDRQTLASQQQVERLLADLNERIVSCTRCPRLRSYCAEVSIRKKPQYRDWDYWGRPLPGFGDPLARLFIVGLAPAAHGGNRTGRMFTGDSSGDWLVRALHQTGFANQPISFSRTDGLKLRDVYITATVRCAPPDNRPLPQEIANCYEYVRCEFTSLPNIRVMLALGRIGFQTCLKLLRERGVVEKPPFSHGAVYRFGPSIPILVCSFHPSRQNTQTGRLGWDEWIAVFQKIRGILSSEKPA
jgi:uracil-DNA glycosylase family 4